MIWYYVCLLCNFIDKLDKRKKITFKWLLTVHIYWGYAELFYSIYYSIYYSTNVFLVQCRSMLVQSWSKLLLHWCILVQCWSKLLQHWRILVQRCSKCYYSTVVKTTKLSTCHNLLSISMWNSVLHTERWLV